MRVGFYASAVAVLALISFAPAPTFAARTPVTDMDGGATHPALFGSREIHAQSTWRFKQWTDMLERTQYEIDRSPGVCKINREENCMPQEWRQLLDQMANLDLRGKLELANHALNQQPYVTTEQNWHRVMYWETPYEFLRYGGQCQDYAIAKYHLLREAGVPIEDLRMVVLHDTANGLDHAVLAAYVDGDALLLDNLNPQIVPADSVDIYRPYYSINETGWWLHIGGRAMSRVASN